MGWNVRVVEVVRHVAVCDETTFHKSGKPWSGPERTYASEAEDDRHTHWRAHEDVRFSLEPIEDRDPAPIPPCESCEGVMCEKLDITDTISGECCEKCTHPEMRAEYREDGS